MENGLVRKEEKSRGLNFHFGDEQDGGRDSSESKSTVEQFSDRTTDTTAEILGEKARLEKENSALKADIARLRERLALERKVTGGNTFNENLLDAAARHIRALGKSDYDIKQLKEEMRDVYTYIATTENLSWDVLMAKCDDVLERPAQNGASFNILMKNQ